MTPARLSMPLLVLAAACAAPAAERATGPLADEIERAIATGTATFDHGAWDDLLAGGTRDGLVDYGYMAAHEAELDAYLESLASADLAALSGPELEALLINAYNALTVRAILDHPEVSSIRDIDGVWTALEWTVGGHSVTLDNIEHNLLRPFFEDPRIHFAVNCASRSCAPLPTWAYTGAELDAQLDERSRAFLTNPDNVAFEGGELRVSRYFDWYGEDFTRSGWSPRAETIPAFIAGYATPAVRAAIDANPEIAVSFSEYDWSLNAAPGTDRAAAAASDAPRSSGSAGGAGATDGSTSGPGGATGSGEGAASSGWVGRLRAWVAGFGPLAPVVYGLVYVVAVVLVVPASALTVGAGVAFGLGVGTLMVILSATIGACFAFLLGRYLLRSRVERWLAGREKLSAVDRAVGEQGWRVVALTRLSPAFPFNVQNYFYGLTRVGFWPYAIASLFAMLPGTLLYVYIGVAGAEVAEAAGGAAGWGRTTLLVAGLLATLLVVVLITRVARRELQKATAAA